MVSRDRTPRGRLALLVTGLTVATLLLPGVAMAGKKALVIGVAGYDAWTPSKNPRNDAEDIGAELTRLGFAQ